MCICVNVYLCLIYTFVVRSHNAWCLSAGGPDEHAGEDEAGAGFHQAASLLHTAVPAGEGHPPDQHETGAQETAGGDPGDEVSAIMILDVTHKDCP